MGRYVGGKASGVCWSFVSGGGAVVGKVDTKGKLTGDEVACSDWLNSYVVLTYVLGGLHLS